MECTKRTPRSKPQNVQRRKIPCWTEEKEDDEKHDGKKGCFMDDDNAGRWGLTTFQNQTRKLHVVRTTRIVTDARETDTVTRRAERNQVTEI